MGNKDRALKVNSMQIGVYNFILPSWWESIDIEVPLLNSEDTIEEYVKTMYGKETGTLENWQYALKTYAIAFEEIDRFPVYIGHCFRTGKDYNSAAKIYSDLYELADTQNYSMEWYQSYLGYCAGNTYELTGDIKNAKKYYSLSVRHINNSDDGISYYANRSNEKLLEFKYSENDKEISSIDIKQIKLLEETIENYYKIYGKKPSNDIIASRLGWSISLVKTVQLEKIELEHLTQEKNYSLENLMNNKENDTKKNELIKAYIEEALEKLPCLEREILKTRFALMGSPYLTIEKTADKFGISNEEVNDLTLRALRRLRNPNISMKLYKLYKGISDEI